MNYGMFFLHDLHASELVNPNLVIQPPRARMCLLFFFNLITFFSSFRTFDSQGVTVFKQELNSSVTSCDKARRGGKIYCQYCSDLTGLE
jgi:hypothetical protein